MIRNETTKFPAFLGHVTFSRHWTMTAPDFKSRQLFFKKNKEIENGHLTEQIRDNIDKATSFSDKMQPTKSGQFPSKERFSVCLCGRWRWRHKPNFSNRCRFVQKFSPHGAKAKDRIYKKQGTWNRGNKITECKMRKFKRGKIFTEWKRLNTGS